MIDPFNVKRWWDQTSQPLAERGVIADRDTTPWGQIIDVPADHPTISWAPGEERAWNLHSLMFSDDARPVMTAETRGQNSWLNFGPNAEHNVTAKGADTIFADQKAVRAPDWVTNDPRLEAYEVGPYVPGIRIVGPAPAALLDAEDGYADGGSVFNSSSAVLRPLP